MTTIWRDLTAPLCIIHTLVLFTIFSEFRYSKKKTALYLTCFVGPIAFINVGLYLLLGSERIGQLAILTCVIPSMLIEFPLAKYRDGRYFFTFLATCTVSTLIIGITHILDFYLPGNRYIFMFVSRFLAYPAVEWVSYRHLRKPYLKVQRNVTGGWWLLTAISAMFFVAYVVMFDYPALISRRPAELPSMLLVMALIPLTYVGIFVVLFRQLDASRLREQEQLLHSQVAIMQQRVEQTARTEELLSIQRHDLRHRFSALDGLLQQGDIAAAREYIASSYEALAETKPLKWCKNSVLNAVFAYYFACAETEHIRIDAELDFPKDLSVDVTELSTVFANMLENAINAVRVLPENKRVIRCKGIHNPQVMFRVSNPYQGEVAFDRQGCPITKEPDHGIGTRSIAAYCEKHNAYCAYEVRDGLFEAYITHA